MSGFGSAIGGLGSLAGGIMDYKAATQRQEQTQQLAEQAQTLANQNAEVAQKQLDLAWDQWNDYKQNVQPLGQAMANASLEQLSLDKPLRAAQRAEALSDIDLYRGLKQAQVNTAMDTMSQLAPLRRQVVQDAMAGVTADVPGAQGRAVADVRQSFAKTRDAEERRLRGLGLNLGRLETQELPTRLAEAASEAAQRTRAGEAERNRAEQTTRQLRLSALGLADDLPGLQPQARLGLPQLGGVADTSDSAMNLMRSAQAGLGQASANLSSTARALGSSPLPSMRQAFGSLSGGRSGSNDASQSWWD